MTHITINKMIKIMNYLMTDIMTNIMTNIMINVMTAWKKVHSHSGQLSKSSIYRWIFPLNHPAIGVPHMFDESNPLVFAGEKSLLHQVPSPWDIIVM